MQYLLDVLILQMNHQVIFLFHCNTYSTDGFLGTLKGEKKKGKTIGTQLVLHFVDQIQIFIPETQDKHILMIQTVTQLSGEQRKWQY